MLKHSKSLFIAVTAIVVGSIALPGSATASDFTYTPINPSFGGSSFNSSHLLGLANAQNEPKSKADAEAAARREQTNADRFIQMLQTRLYSSLAQQVSNAIFGEDAQPQGSMRLDDQEISWLNTGTEIQLVVVDNQTGQVTEVVIPTITQ